MAFGSQGPDISAIPAVALRQVEVLRDGRSGPVTAPTRYAGVLNFQLKDARAGGSVELNTGMYRAGDGEAARFAGNIGLPLGATGFANLSLEYGQREPDKPGRAAARCGHAHRRWQYARFLRPPAGLGRPGHRRRSEGVRQLRLHPARRHADVRPHQLCPQEGRLRRLLPQPEHAPRGVQQRPRPHTAGRRRAGGERHGIGRLSDGRCQPTTYRTRSPCSRCRDDPNCFTFQELFPRRLHAADGGHGGRRVARRRGCAAFHGRRLRLGPERLARRAPHRPLRPQTPSTLRWA